VPAGSATLTVDYIGYSTATETVNVTAGQTASREISLTSTAQGTKGADGTIRLEAFNVSSDREGNAKAIMQQRRNMNISTSVASDIYGDVAEGNVGEFLKFLPGVDVEYVDAESRGPRLGGLDPQYVGVTIDGSKMASADAFASYNGMINGAVGAGVRSMGFEQMSITSIESIEISRTTSADMDADAPAGTINLRTKRAFDRKGRRIDWQASLSANSDDFTWGKTYRPSDHQSRLIRPDFTFDYSDVFLNQRLGIRLGLAQSKVLFQQQYVTHTYSNVATTTDPRPQVLTAIVFSDGPKFVDRSTVSLAADFKASSRLVLSMTAMFNAYDGATYTRATTFTAAANNANVNTGRGTVVGSLSDFRTNGLANNTARAVSITGGQNFDKFTNTITFSPKFEYTLGGLLVEGGATYSHSKNDYEAITRGMIRTDTTNNVVADFRAVRPDANSANWTITQLSGPDWSNLANYTNPRVTSDDDRFALVEIWQAETNAKYSTTLLSFPTFIKFGGKINEETRKTENRTNARTFNYVGPGGGPTGSFAAFPSFRTNATHFGHEDVLTIANPPPVVNREALGALFTTHPEYFVNNATVDNYYTAIYANKRDFRQIVSAAYGMANTRIGKLQLQGGLRWERTQTDSKEFNPKTAAQVVAAGFPISATTRRATTVPGIDYQYGSNPRTTRTGIYDEFFPSASVRYLIRPNLHAQFGYSHAISRAPVNSLAGVWSIDDVNLVVTAPNTALRPEISNNYVARVAYYFEPVGSVSLLVQQNEISDLAVTRRFTADEFGSEDPDFAGYTFVSMDNGTALYRYRSMELSYNSQLSFLPGPFKGTSLNLGYTRSYANQWRPGVLPHKVSAVLAWRYGRVNLRLGSIWQDDHPYTTVFGRYLKHNAKFDLSGGFQLTRRTSLFFQGRNILNQPQLIFEGDPTRNVAASLYRFGNYGTSWVFGLKGNF
jgi:TonB-dependent receptor